MDKYQKELEIAGDIALKAGEVMLKYFEIDQQVQIKSDNSPVTIADKMINKLVIEELAKSFPADGVIGEEESNSEYGSGRKWVCDPIDGTIAYLWGIPTSMFSLALVVDGVPVVGVTYDPYLKRMYTGVRGNGSFCNGARLRVSDSGLDGGIVAVTGSIANIHTRTYIPKFKEHGARVASFSGAVYKACLVARANFIAFIEHGLNAHDLAAVQVIIDEAGGRISDLQGNSLSYHEPFKAEVVISNGKAHEELLSVLRS